MNEDLVNGVLLGGALTAIVTGLCTQIPWWALLLTVLGVAWLVIFVQIMAELSAGLVDLAELMIVEWRGVVRAAKQRRTL